MTYPTKKLAVLVIALIVIGVAISGWFCPNILPWLTLVVLTLTLAVLLWYAYDTHRMAEASKKATDEIITQTQLQQKPILIPFVKIKNSETSSGLLEYYIPGLENEYIIKIRNIGYGAAANLIVKVEKQGFVFEVEGYQQNFLAPEGDERAIGVVRIGQGNKREKLTSITELYGATFSFGCQDFSERFTADNDEERYWFKYKLTVDDRKNHEDKRWQEIRFHYIEDKYRKNKP